MLAAGDGKGDVARSACDVKDIAFGGDGGLLHDVGQPQLVGAEARDSIEAFVFLRDCREDFLHAFGGKFGLGFLAGGGVDGGRWLLAPVDDLLGSRLGDRSALGSFRRLTLSLRFRGSAFGVFGDLLAEGVVINVFAVVFEHDRSLQSFFSMYYERRRSQTSRTDTV